MSSDRAFFLWFWKVSQLAYAEEKKSSFWCYQKGFPVVWIFFFFLPKKQFLSMPGLITRRRREPARTETRGTESQDWAGKTNTIINDRKCNIKWIKKPSTVSRVPDDETHNSDHICMINERGSLQSTSWSNNLLNIKAAQTSVGLKLFTSSHYTFNWTFLSISWPQWECFPATKDLNPRLKKNKQKTGTQQIQ